MNRARNAGAGSLLVLLIAFGIGLPAWSQMNPAGQMGMHGMMMRSRPPPAKAPEALDRYGCMACHDVKRQGVGPTFAEIARRYQGKAGAEAKLAAFIEHGGQGHWPGTMPDLDVPGADADALARWILALPPQAPASEAKGH
jgi:cytochrome c